MQGSTTDLLLEFDLSCYIASVKREFGVAGGMATDRKQLLEGHRDFDVRILGGIEGVAWAKVNSQCQREDAGLAAINLQSCSSKYLCSLPPILASILTACPSSFSNLTMRL